MRTARPSSSRCAVGIALLAALVVPSCSGGSAGDPDNRGTFKVNLVTTGLGQVFPYRIRQSDLNGNPTFARAMLAAWVELLYASI